MSSFDLRVANATALEFVRMECHECEAGPFDSLTLVVRSQYPGASAEQMNVVMYVEPGAFAAVQHADELVAALRAYLPFLPPEYAKASMVANPEQLTAAAAFRAALAKVTP